MIHASILNKHVQELIEFVTNSNAMTLDEVNTQEINKLSPLVVNYNMNKYNGKVVLIKAKKIPELEQRQNVLSADHFLFGKDNYMDNVCNGLEEYVSDLEVYSVDGAHLELFKTPVVASVAETIKHVLLRCEEEQTDTGLVEGSTVEERVLERAVKRGDEYVVEGMIKKLKEKKSKIGIETMEQMIKKSGANAKILELLQSL